MSALTRTAASLAAAAGVVLLAATPAWAANGSLTTSPASGPAGTQVTLTYTNPQCNYGDSAHFELNGTALAPDVSMFSTQTPCQAQKTYTMTSSDRCGANDFAAVNYSPAQQQQPDMQNAAHATFTLTCASPSSPKPTPSGATSSPAATRTSSAPAGAATSSAGPSAVSSSSSAPATSSAATSSAATSSAAIVSATTRTSASSSAPPALADGADGATALGGPDSVPDASSISPGGLPRLAWLAIGTGLAAVGIGVAVGVLRPRGTGTPVVVGTALGATLLGAYLGLHPLPKAEKPLVIGSYTDVKCAPGDIPISGGYHLLDPSQGMLRFRPTGDSSTVGAWEVGSNAPSDSSVVCLKLSRPVPWTVREGTFLASALHGSATCQPNESVLGGGFYFPWRLTGRTGSYPTNNGWGVEDGPNSAAIYGSAYAVCAQLPEGTRTYMASASTPNAGDAVAYCKPGDVVINGGYAGEDLRGSYPVGGGWAASFGSGKGGWAYALCVQPSAKFGIRSSSVYTNTSTVQTDTACGGATFVLGGGWQDGRGLESLQHNEPQGTAGWRIAPADGGRATSLALCFARK